MAFVSVPCKRTTEVDLRKPIITTIADVYGIPQTASIEEVVGSLQALRNKTISKLGDKHESAAQIIAQYHDAIFFVESRVPMNVSGARVEWKWYDALSPKTSIKVCSSSFERACLLFCYAAIHSQIAETQNLNDVNALQQAVKSYQIAAGVFDFLAVHSSAMVQREPTPDLSSDALMTFSSIMLAQAQEVILIKAERDNMKATILSKLAAQTYNLYAECLKHLGMSSLKSVISKEWSSIFSTKSTQYQAVAEYYAAQECGEQKSYGQQLSRLREAQTMFKNLAARAGPGFTRKHWVDKIKRERDVAEKDNNCIYHETVPEHSSLPPIVGAAVAKKLAVELPLGGSSAKDLFTELVPVPVFEATKQADTIRASMVGVELGRLREATDSLNVAMASRNLPAAIQTKKEQEVPNSLLEKAARIRQMGGAIKLLEQVSSLPESAKRNIEILTVQKATLEDEEQADNNLRAQYGERWSRQSSSKLNAHWRQEIDKFLGIFEKTQATDKTLYDRYVKHTEEFELLSKPEGELLTLLKAGAANLDTSSPTGNQAARDELAVVCDSMETLKKDRNDLQEQLQQIKVPDDLQKKLLDIYNAKGKVDDQQLLIDAMNVQLEGVRECVRESVERQVSLLADLNKKADVYFGQSSDGPNKSMALVTRLTLAADEFFQLDSDVKQGMKFYADVTEVCLKTQAKIDDFCFARKTEKNELMADITASLSRPDAAVKQSPSTDPAPAIPPERPPPTYKPSTTQQDFAPPVVPPVATTAPSAPPGSAYTAGQPPPPWANPATPSYGYSMATYPPAGGFAPMPTYGYYGAYMPPPHPNATGQAPPPAMMPQLPYMPGYPAPQMGQYPGYLPQPPAS